MRKGPSACSPPGLALTMEHAGKSTASPGTCVTVVVTAHAACLPVSPSLSGGCLHFLVFRAVTGSCPLPSALAHLLSWFLSYD